MRIPTWRLALTGGAIAILAVVGIGAVAAATAHPSGPVADGSAQQAAGQALRPRISAAGPGHHPLLRARHLVHASVTVTAADGSLVTFQLDHGTVAAIGNGTITISEAGGGSATVKTDGDTRVRDGRDRATLGEVKTGAEVFVRSRVDGSSTLAKVIVLLPAATTGSGG